MTQILQIINSAYPNSKYDLSKGLVRTWEIALGHYDWEILKKAVMQTLATCKFTPTIADINSSVKALFAVGLQTAPEAWECVMKELSEEGLEYRYSAFKRVSGFDGKNGNYMVRCPDYFATAEEARAWAGEGGDVHSVRIRLQSFIAPGSLTERALKIVGGLEAIDGASTLEFVRPQFIKIYNELRERSLIMGTMSPALLGTAMALGKRASLMITDGEPAETAEEDEE